jgi:hypothetical protein
MSPVRRTVIFFIFLAGFMAFSLVSGVVMHPSDRFPADSKEAAAGAIASLRFPGKKPASHIVSVSDGNCQRLNG